MKPSKSPIEVDARANSVSRGDAEARRFVRTTPNEHACLVARADGGGEWVYHFVAIERHSGLPRQLVRRHVRALARKGLAVYRKGLWTDDGRPAGAGYGITPLGLETLRASAPPREPKQ